MGPSGHAWKHLKKGGAETYLKPFPIGKEKKKRRTELP